MHWVILGGIVSVRSSGGLVVVGLEVGGKDVHWFYGAA